MRVRIEDVAAAAGVSMKTVSRVLNNEPTVKDTTRLRVQAVAKSLNYRPDPSARSLAGRKSYLIALLYDNPSANYLMEILTGVVEACEQYHYGMVVQPVAYNRPDFMQTVESLAAFSRLDGLILTPPLTDSVALLDRLEELGIPHACVSPRVREGGIGVTLDEQEAAREMIALLASMGHTRIAHIRGHTAHGASEWRHEGYCNGLRQAGIDYDPTLVVQGEFSFDSGMRAAHALLDLDAPPTAIFAANDDMAAGVMSVAHGRGLDIPGDLSVCGFDDTPVSRQIFPTLTTVHQPARDMGRQATVELLKAIQNPASGQMTHMPYALQVRDSTGPAPTRAT